jgi:hypothetical protein
MQLLECAIDAQMCTAALEMLPTVRRRENVVRRLENQDVLANVALHFPQEAVRTAALLRLKDKVVRYRAIKTITNSHCLKTIIDEEPCGYLKAAALARVEDQKLLSELMLQILNNELVCPLPPAVLQRFFDLIDDQFIFGMFVSYYRDRPKSAAAAVDKIHDHAVLLDIIQNRLVHSDPRKFALRKIPGDMMLWEDTACRGSLDDLDFGGRPFSVDFTGKPSPSHN